jgi:hypothetical protein
MRTIPPLAGLSVRGPPLAAEGVRVGIVSRDGHNHGKARDAHVARIARRSHAIVFVPHRAGVNRLTTDGIEACRLTMPRQERGQEDRRGNAIQNVIIEARTRVHLSDGPGCGRSARPLRAGGRLGCERESIGDSRHGAMP